MYAIIEVGAKQYPVKKGEVIDVEKLEGEKGKEVTISNVLLLAGDGQVQVGTPFVKGAKVQARIITQAKGVKVVSYKYRRRKASHTKIGHRQQLTRLEITDIAGA